MRVTIESQIAILFLTNSRTAEHVFLYVHNHQEKIYACFVCTLKDFSLRHPLRAPAHVYGNIGLFKGIKAYL